MQRMEIALMSTLVLGIISMAIIGHFMGWDETALVPRRPTFHLLGFLAVMGSYLFWLLLLSYMVLRGREVQELVQGFFAATLVYGPMGFIISYGKFIIKPHQLIGLWLGCLFWVGILYHISCGLQRHRSEKEFEKQREQERREIEEKLIARIRAEQGLEENKQG